MLLLVSRLLPIINYFDKLLHQKKSSSNIQMDSLDGLRGIAVLFVIFSHIHSEGIDITILNRFNLGKYGVSLFFVLSSFLLTIPFLRKPEINLSSYSLWSRYTNRRLLRIYPLYLTILLLAWALSKAGYGYLYIPDFKLISVLKHLVLVEGREFLWTIPTEITYYLILPIVTFLFVKFLNRKLYLIIPATALIIIVNLVIYHYHYQWLGYKILMLPHLPVFFIGSMTAMIHINLLEREKHNKNLKFVWECIALASLFFLVLLILSDAFSAYPLIRGLLWACFIVGHLHGSSVMREVLSNTSLRFIGIISFGMYLWHPLIIKTVNTYLFVGVPIKVLLITLTTVIISTLSYFYIERPFLASRPSKVIQGSNS